MPLCIHTHIHMQTMLHASIEIQLYFDIRKTYKSFTRLGGCINLHSLYGKLIVLSYRLDVSSIYKVDYLHVYASAISPCFAGRWGCQLCLHVD